MLGVIEMAESENWVHFRNKAGFILSCRRFVDHYDSEIITRTIQGEGTKIALPKQLKDACDLANVFSQQNAEYNMVQVDLKPGSPGKVKVTGKGLTGKASKTLSANWSGNPMSFLIPPAVLSEVATRYNEVQINDDILKVDGGSYVYASMLSPPVEDKK